MLVKRHNNNPDVGGDKKARHICESCKHETIYPIINPTIKEIDKWLNEGVCKFCRKKFRQKKTISLKKYFKHYEKLQ